MLHNRLYAAAPYIWYGLGSLCFLVGTLIVLKRTFFP